MVAVAEQPEYQDWRMLDNVVSVDPEREKIVLYRALRRVAVRPGSDKVRQDREYQFEIKLEPANPKDPDAPATVVFATYSPETSGLASANTTIFSAAEGRSIRENVGVELKGVSWS